MDMSEAMNLAGEAAGLERSGWNARYRQQLERCGYRLVPWEKGVPSPPGTINAPLPMEGDPDSWHAPSIVVPLEPDFFAVTDEMAAEGAQILENNYDELTSVALGEARRIYCAMKLRSPWRQT